MRKIIGYAVALNELAADLHDNNVEAGWYSNPVTGERIDRNVPEMIALMHSELSEALEGIRKSMLDDHLPKRPMAEVEFADCIIRILDTCGYLGYDIGGALEEKAAYNQTRADHQLANRKLEGGKKF